MKLYTYKNQLVRFFNEFNKVNISFTEIKAKLSTAGIVVKDSEEKGALFDTMQKNSDQLKDAITTLDSLLKEDEKNKTNDAEAFFFGTFRPLLENLSKEQATFTTFVTKNTGILDGKETLGIYGMFNAVQAGVGTCVQIDNQKQKSVRNMKLDAYKAPIENLFTTFDNINISFTELKAQLPAGRIAENEGEEKGNFFDTMQEKFGQLKTAVDDLRNLMVEDDKNNTKKAADFFFDKFQILLEKVKDEQDNFQAFLKENDYSDLSIPGMNDVYKVFNAANSGLGLCYHIAALNEKDKVSAARSEYEQAHAEYKAAKKDLIEKYNGQDVKKLLEDSEQLIKDATRKKSEYNTAHENLVTAENSANKALPDLEEQINSLNKDIPNAEKQISSYNKKIKIIDEYKNKLKEAEEQYLKPNEDLENELTVKTALLKDVESKYQVTGSKYSSSSLKLNSAMLTNSEITDEIESRKKLAECNIIIQFLSDAYADVQNTAKYDDLNPEVKAIIEMHVENVGNNPTLAQIHQDLIAKMPELSANLKSEPNDSVKDAIQEYAARALEVFKAEKDIKQMQKEVDETSLKIQNNKDEYAKAAKQHFENFKDAGVLGKHTIKASEGYQKATPETFGKYLDDMTKLYDDLSTKASTQKASWEKIIINLNNQKQKINDDIKNLKAKDAELNAAQAKLFEEYNSKNSIEAEVKNLAGLYHNSQQKRKAAVDAYAAYKKNIEKGELTSVKDAATKLFARVGDAAKGHKNSTEFQNLENALGELKDADPTGVADKIAKLQEIKNLAETYKQAKLDQHFHWIPSTLRKTRLQFADDVIAATKERIERLAQFGDNELGELETLFGENSKNQEKVNKGVKKDHEFTAALTKKTMAATENKKEELAKEDDGAEMGRS